MTELFYTILNMSISASMLVLVVLLLRLVFRKAPKWVTVLLWGLVAVRLICPFAFETPFSLMPKTEWVMEELPYPAETIVPDVIDPEEISGRYPGIQVSAPVLPSPEITVHRGFSISFILACIWLVGMVAMLVYLVLSCIRIDRRIRNAKHFQDNIYTSETIASPFVFGVIKPCIFLPENMDAVSMSYVLSHEEAHISRKDHLWKPLGFLLLTIHWFNPLIWIGYILLCRDIEMACDERVVRTMNAEERVDYSEALLECSVSRKMITACPLAFGEVGAKERIKTVLNYKKPAFWIVVLAVIACVAVAVCFLTNPLNVRNPWVQEYVVGAEGILGQVDKEKFESISEDFAIGADQYGRAVFKNPEKAFSTMKKLYADGLTLICTENKLPPISQTTYKLYKIFGWQVTSGSVEAQQQASFISGFLDIYENSFDKEKPNTDLPDPTVEGETGSENIVASNVSEETLTYWVLKGHQEEIWAYRNTAINDTVDEVFRKWGERIAAVGVNAERNCVDVYVYDFDEGDIGRFKKALGHLSYVLIQKDGVIEMIPEEKKQLTLEDVIQLSAKGTDLTWEDFYEFESIETGSGLYIRVYEIDETFSLWIGGGAPIGKPMYIRLKLNDGLEYVDVTEGDIALFISRYGELFNHPRSYYTDIAWPAALSAAEAENIRLDKDRYVNILYDYNGQTLWLQFLGIRDGDWDNRSVAVTLVRGENGEYSVMAEGIQIIDQQEIQKNLAISQIQNNIRYLEEIIEANPSKYAADIPRDGNAYKNIFRYSDVLVLEYIFSEFLAGGQTDLHGFLLWQVMMDCLNESEIITYDAETGQDYFDQWLASARAVHKQHDPEWLEANVPAIALVLKMADE